MVRLSRSDFDGNTLVLDTNVLKSWQERGLLDDCIVFLNEVGAKAAVCSTILHEVLTTEYKKIRIGFLFPQHGREEIVHLLDDEKLVFLDVPVASFCDCYIQDMKFPFMKNQYLLGGRDQDYLIAVTVIGHNATLVTANWADFYEFEKARTLRLLHLSDVEDFMRDEGFSI